MEGCVLTSGKRQLYLAFVNLCLNTSCQKPVTPELAHVMGLLHSATTWSSALLSWALSSFLPLHEPREGCFPFCWLASEPCQLCRFCLLVLSCWLHGPCWKPAQATQATWRTFAELHCGTCLNPRRVHRQYYEYFPSHLQYIAMAQGSKYWLALATRLLQVRRAAVWMRNSPREREKKKRNWDETISYCLQNGNIKAPNRVKQWCNQDWKLALQG